MELNAEMVKEAMEHAERTKMNLERCKYGKEKPNCSECDFKPWIKPICQRLLCYVALELITSQEQRIKELAEENEARKACNKMLDIEIRRLGEENERLREKADRNLENLKAVLEERSENTIVADTVRKMQEKLIKGAFCSACGIDYSHHIIQIAKEMLEGEK